MDDIRRKLDKVYQTIKSLPLTIFNEEGNIPRSGNKPLFTDIDATFLKQMNNQLSDCVFIGDKGYLSSSLQLDLFHKNVTLDTPMRSNQNNYRKQPWVFRKTRKRIETLFSQLCDQFMIRRNYAKSFDGFKTRVLAKITALTLIQYINRFDLKRPIYNLKVNIC